MTTVDNYLLPFNWILRVVKNALVDGKSDPKIHRHGLGHKGSRPNVHNTLSYWTSTKILFLLFLTYFGFFWAWRQISIEQKFLPFSNNLYSVIKYSEWSFFYKSRTNQYQTDVFPDTFHSLNVNYEMEMHKWSMQSTLATCLVTLFNPGINSHNLLIL